MKKRKKENGYISIEVAIVGGLIIGLGVLTVNSFNRQANKVAESGIKYIADTSKEYKVIGPSI